MVSVHGGDWGFAESGAYANSDSYGAINAAIHPFTKPHTNSDGERHTYTNTYRNTDSYRSFHANAPAASYANPDPNAATDTSTPSHADAKHHHSPSYAHMSARTVRLINDCSSYHIGSQLVAKEIRRKLESVGLLEVGAEAEADLYLVNGEGTLHWDFPGVTRIQKEIANRPTTSRLVIINSLWSKMTKRFAGVALAVARESSSFNQMKKDKAAEEILMIPDISLCCTHQPPHTGGGGLMVIDSVCKKTSAWLREFAAKNGGRFINLCEWKDSPEAFIDLLTTADAVVSGRFHGVMLAILAGAPFLGAPSNSWKTRAFLEDMGLGQHYHKSLESLEAAFTARQFGRADRQRLPQIDLAWSQAFQRIVTAKPLPPGPMAEIRPQMATKSVLPTAPQIQAVWSMPKSVVLVGNGPGVIGANIGAIIDAHDEVVRFNNFKTAGFERDIGAKTTLWSTFGKGVVPADSPPPVRVVLVHENATPAGSPQQVFRLPSAFYKRMMEEIRAISKHQKASEVTPTSGFLVTRWLLESGCPHVNLAGFDHFSKAKSGQHHYWNVKTFARPADHDGDAERQLLQPFLIAGRLAYLC